MRRLDKKKQLVEGLGLLFGGAFLILAGMYLPIVVLRYLDGYLPHWVWPYVFVGFVFALLVGLPLIAVLLQKRQRNNCNQIP